MKQTIRRLVAPAAALALLTPLAACGDDGPKLNDQQKDVASRLESDGHLSKKDAECIAGKLSGDGLDAAKHDANFSELNGYSGGEAVAKAFTDCTGKSFEDTYHYSPRG